MSSLVEFPITNASLQADEIQALSSIFDSEWSVEDEVEKVYSINISNSSDKVVYLQVIFPESYPLDSPPIYRISAPWMSRDAKNVLCSFLEDIYCSNIGESIIYLWIEKIRDFIEGDEVNESGNAEVVNNEELNDAHIQEQISQLKIAEKEWLDEELPMIEHGEPLIDRKSVFQAHVARIVTEDQVKRVLSKLKENRKIATATHNMYAYRIERENKNTFLQDCEDDGETKAGSNLLHLLQLVGASNVLVVVSRWYGGIHLGPDRFKHINNVARSVLSKAGFITEKQPNLTKKTKKK